MSLELASVLKKHVTDTKELTLKKGWKEIPKTLFYNQEGNPLDSANIAKRCFHRYLEKSGLRRVKFHSLRHSFASIHIANGESLAYIRDQLGHHSIQVTVDMYGHLVPGSNREAADRLLANTQPIRN
jgi:integrase